MNMTKQTKMLIAAAAVGGLIYYFMKKKAGAASVAEVFPWAPRILTGGVSVADPNRPSYSSGTSYADRAKNRSNAVIAAKYVQPKISDTQAQAVADAFMASGLGRSYIQRVLTPEEFAQLGAFQSLTQRIFSQATGSGTQSFNM